MSRKQLCDTIRNELQGVLQRPGKKEQGLDFICEADVEGIWTLHRVKSLSKGLTWDTPLLHEKSRTHFRRILSILVWIHWERWAEFKMIFLDHGFRSDSNLPLPDDQVPDHHEMRHKFPRDQYIFCPVTLAQDRRHEKSIQQVYDKQIRMPFIRSIKIGEGATSIVTKELIAANHFRSTPDSLNSKPIWVARKQFREGNISSKNFVAEQEALTSFKQCLKSNANIMLSFTTYIHNSCFNIILPLADLDLRHFLHSNYPDFKERQQDFSPLYLLQELACLADALDFLHFQLKLRDKVIACAHLDFKPENILVQWCAELPVGRWLITDFGTARIKESSEVADALAPGDFLTHFSFTKAQRLPGPFQAPEVQTREDRVVGRESDLWSLGCLLAFVLAFAIGGKGHVSGLLESTSYTDDLNETETDYFYRRINGRDILKPTLTKWLDGLKTDKRGDRWINDALELVFKLLLEDPHERLSASETQIALYSICREEREFLQQKCCWIHSNVPRSSVAPEVVETKKYQHPSMSHFRISEGPFPYPGRDQYLSQEYHSRSRHQSYSEPPQGFMNGGSFQQPQNEPRQSSQHAPYPDSNQNTPYDQRSQQQDGIYSDDQRQQNPSQGQYSYPRENIEFHQDTTRPRQHSRRNIPKSLGTQQAQIGDQQNSAQARFSKRPTQNIKIPTDPLHKGDRVDLLGSSSPYHAPSTHRNSSSVPSIYRVTASRTSIPALATYPLSPNPSDGSSSSGNTVDLMTDVSFLRLNVPDKSLKSVVSSDGTRVALLSPLTVVIHRLGNHHHWLEKLPSKPDPALGTYHSYQIAHQAGFEWDIISLCGNYAVLRAKNTNVKTDYQFFRYRCVLAAQDPTMEVWKEEPFLDVYDVNLIASSVVDVAVNYSGDTLFTLDSEICYYSSTRGFDTLPTEAQWQVRKACFSSDGQRIFAWLSSPHSAKSQESSWYTWNSNTSSLIAKETRERKPAEHLGNGKNNLIFPFSRSFAAFEIPNRLYVVNNESSTPVVQITAPVEDVIAGAVYQCSGQQGGSHGLILVQSQSPRIINIPLTRDVQSSKASKSQKLQKGFHEKSDATAIVSDTSGSFVIVTHPNGVVERRKFML